MQRIKEKKITPNGGFIYTQPESGKTFDSIELSALMDKVQRHRLENGYNTAPGWEKEVEDSICKQGKTSCEEDVEPKRKIGGADVKNFLVFIGKMIESKGAGQDCFVSQEEANRRAKICVTCPNNQKIGCWGGCPGNIPKAIKTFLDMVKQDNLSTPYDDQLKSCAICGCANQAQVHIAIPLLKGVKGEYDYPNFCWKTTLCN